MRWRTAIVSALALQLEGSSPILSSLAERRENNELSPQRYAWNLLTRSVVVKLRRLIGLSMRIHSEFGDRASVIQLLAVTFEKTTHLFEQKDMFGLLSTFEANLNPRSRSEYVLPIINVDLGGKNEVDKAMGMKKPPKTRDIISAIKSLVRALEDLPEGV